MTSSPDRSRACSVDCAPPRLDAPLVPRLGAWGWPALAVAGAAYLMARRWGFAMDDPWITYRYGRNLAGGLGFVFNPGERIEGYSNFLLVWLAALLERLRLDVFDFTRLGGGLCLLGSVWLLARGERRLFDEEARIFGRQAAETAAREAGERGIPVFKPLAEVDDDAAKATNANWRRFNPGFWAWTGTLYLALSPAAATWAVGGLETPYYLLAALATWLLAARTWSGRTASDATSDMKSDATSRDKTVPQSEWAWGLATGVAAFAAALIRIDGFVVAGGLAVFIGWELLRRRRPRAWGPVVLAVLVFCMLYCVYTLWRWRYFGTWMPNTAQAKTTGTLAGRVRDGAKYLFDWTERGGGIGLLVALWGLMPRTLPMNPFAAPSNEADQRATTPELRPGADRVYRAPGRDDGPNGGGGSRNAAGSTVSEGEALLRLAACLAAALFAMTLYAGGDWMPAARFVVPALGFVGVLVGAGLRRWRGRGHLGRGAALLCAAWIAFGVSSGDRNDETLQWCLRMKEQRALWQPLREMGHWIGAVAEPDEWLAATEAGIVPYYSRLPFIDMLGLVDAHIASLPGGLHEKFDADYVIGRAPRFVLLGVTAERDDRGRPRAGIWPPDEQMLRHRAFHETYALRRVWDRPSPVGEPMVMELYERRER